MSEYVNDLQTTLEKARKKIKRLETIEKLMNERDRD